MLRWTEDDLWHEGMRLGSVLHQQYVRAVIFPNKSVMNALGLDAFHSSPSEYIAHLDRLLEKHAEFSDLRRLFAQRSLRTLTDVCLGCHASGHVVTLTGDSICAACNVNIAQLPVSLQACFAATSREAHARAGQACAFVLIL